MGGGISTNKLNMGNSFLYFKKALHSILENKVLPVLPKNSLSQNCRNADQRSADSPLGVTEVGGAAVY